MIVGAENVEKWGRMKCGECALLNFGFDLASGQTCALCPHKEHLAYPFADVEDDACEDFEPAYTGTLDHDLWPLMEVEGCRQRFCCVCGRTYPLNQHHLVKRSAGTLFRKGIELEKPTITLCGSGNTSGCHGLAHSYRLHFRNDGELEYLVTNEPTKYSKALQMKGWRPIHRASAWEE